MSTPDSMTTQHTPPAPAHQGEPQATLDDPSAAGYYCAGRRSDQQIRAATEQGGTPWPWCRMRAGWGTDHLGVGACKLHAGGTPNARKAAQLKLEELRDPAIARAAKILVDGKAPLGVVVRVIENVLDRTGHPRRLDVDVDAARENLVERIEAAMQAPEAEN